MVCCRPSGTSGPDPLTDHAESSRWLTYLTTLDYVRRFATALVDLLADAALDRGVHTFVATSFAENQPVVALRAHAHGAGRQLIRQGIAEFAPSTEDRVAFAATDSSSGASPDAMISYPGERRRRRYVAGGQHCRANGCLSAPRQGNLLIIGMRLRCRVRWPFADRTPTRRMLSRSLRTVKPLKNWLTTMPAYARHHRELVRALPGGVSPDDPAG